MSEAAGKSAEWSGDDEGRAPEEGASAGGLGAPVSAGATALEQLVAGLNPTQRQAVEHGEGPLLVLAGAGSGKTRVLTHRIAYLLATGMARPGEILAITFTNKAADEMRSRVEELTGAAARMMWVMTFHSACVRILRQHAERLGYKRGFSIYDEADSLRMLKRCMDDLEIDPKRFPPRSIRGQISGAKNRLRDAETYREEQGSFFEETVADAYTEYERRMHAANAMDFDDLLVRTVNLLELFEDVRDRYARLFRHVLVDEYQDTNRVQYRLLQLLTEVHGNLFVVGDDAQCLARGTEITMADGQLKPIERIEVGDEVRSSYGPARYGPARVSGVYGGVQRNGIAIETRDGRRIVSTEEHMHFAGYQLGWTPQMHMTYVMWRRDKGFRVGTSRVYTAGQVRPIVGFRQRCFNEHADAVWVISTHETEGLARAAEALLSLRYSIPTLPFVARNSAEEASLAGNQGLIDAVFAELDTESAGRRLLVEEGLSFAHPHHRAGTFEGRRRTLTLTLCGERRRDAAMHRLSIAGRDEGVKERLESIGLGVRPAAGKTVSWRYETCFKDFGEVLRTAGRISDAVEVDVRITGRFGRTRRGPCEASSLPCIPAASVRPGMAMFTGDGGYDVVARVERLKLDAPVYDINVEGTHNFVANGVITHNSIYGFRAAEIRNILDFEHDFEGTEVVKLEQNYRSTQNILDASNGVISHNREQMEKRLWSDAANGEPVVIAELADEHEEARWVAGEVGRLADEEGVPRSEIAVFYRTNAQSRVLEDTLVRYDVPYQVIGGTKFYERAEIKDAIAYLTLLINPGDAVSLSRVINMPRRGIGQTSEGRLLAYANTVGSPPLEVAESPESIPGLGAAAVKAIGRFAELIAALRERVERERSVADLLEATLSESGYIEALEAERTIEAEGRVENLRELIGVAAEFDANRRVEGTDPGQQPPLEQFLEQIALFTEQDKLDTETEQVTLMTLHNAKGLEYRAVFIIGCEDGVFPHSRSIDEGSLEEERRLCYVGLTRARERLTLSHARRRALFGATSTGVPSRFLGEIPEGLVERHSTVGIAGTGWGLGERAAGGLGGSGGLAAAEPAAQPLELAVGDDVVHASFGEGVVTAVEPGNVVVVRFGAGERKLMADYAPIQRAS